MLILLALLCGNLQSMVERNLAKQERREKDSIFIFTEHYDIFWVVGKDTIEQKFSLDTTIKKIAVTKPNGKSVFEKDSYGGLDTINYISPWANYALLDTTAYRSDTTITPKLFLLFNNTKYEVMLREGR